MKKITTMFLSFLCISLALIFGNMKSVSAVGIDNTYTFSLNSAINQVEVNNNLPVSISMQGNDVFDSRQLTITYDASKLKFVNCITEDNERVLKATAKNGLLKVYLKSLSPKTSGRVTLNFKALNRGNTIVNLTGVRIANANNQIANLNNISFSSQSFTITDKNIEAFERITAGTGSLDDYNLCGFKNVTEEFVQFINDDLREKNYTTKDQVQERINTNLFNYKYKLKSLDLVHHGTAELANYQALGINNVNNSILPYVNEDMIAFNIANLNDIRARINDNLNLYNALYAIGNGTATVDNYKTAGVSNITDYLLYYVNSRIKDCRLTDASQIRDKAIYIINNAKIYTVKGVVTDSKTGAKVKDATLKFKTPDGNYLNSNGNIVKVVTDANGNYSISLPEGTYNPEASKYYYTTKTVTIISNNLSENTQNNIEIVPDANRVVFKAVLTWGDTTDVDTYLYGKTASGTSFTIYHGGKVYTENGVQLGHLDTDDTNGYGPEITTFVADYNGTYTYKLNRGYTYTKSKVVLYANDQLVREFNVPSGSGSVWNVFTIHNGEVTALNTLSLSL